MNYIPPERAMKILGEEKYEELQVLYAGQAIYFPKKRNPFNNIEERNEWIYEAFRSGKSYEYLAKEVELSIDYVIRIIKDESKKRKRLL